MMLVKALVLLSGSFFGSNEMEAVFLTGYVSGVISLAPPGMWDQEIWFEQMKLMRENAETVSVTNFLAALWGGGGRPILKVGVAMSGLRRGHWILSFYFTGMKTGFG